MAVAGLFTDTWIQHLPFVGGPRPTQFGDVDGMFYGLMAATGDSGGGNVTLSGRLSADRKEDWVYVVGGTHARAANENETGDVFEQINTGPLIPSGVAAITNPTFEYGGPMLAIGNNAVSITPSQRIDKVQGMPIFGDKRIDGLFLMYAAGFENNVDTVTYTAQIWGWIIRYNSFFRDVAPRRG